MRGESAPGGRSEESPQGSAKKGASRGKGDSGVRMLLGAAFRGHLGSGASFPGLCGFGCCFPVVFPPWAKRGAVQLLRRGKLPAPGEAFVIPR